VIAVAAFLTFEPVSTGFSSSGETSARLTEAVAIISSTERAAGAG
jgi:hypothetical protein